MPNARTQRFFNQLPISLWRKRMAGGDDHFTPEALAAAEAELRRFLQEVEAAGEDQNAILAAFERSVKSFDHLNEIHGGFVETLEREELAEFYNSVAEEFGLEHDGDITEPWRMNW